MPDLDKDKTEAAAAETPAAATKPESAARRGVKQLTNIVKEEIIVKRNKVLSMLLYVVMLFTAVISGLIGSVALMGIMGRNGFDLGALIFFVIFGGGAVLMWFSKDYLKVEYEYSFTNGVVDIAQVLNNRRRKELVSIKTREVELVAPIDDPRLVNIEKRPGIKKVKAVLNADSRIYFACFRKNEQPYLVYFEPSEEFLKLMRIYNERNIIL